MSAELAALAAARDKAQADPWRKPLESLLKHRAGLEVFVSQPGVPVDNNSAERALRGPVVGRKLSFGSYAEQGARLRGCLLSVYGTLSLAGIDPYRWTLAVLPACAEQGGPLADVLL